MPEIAPLAPTEHSDLTFGDSMRQKDCLPISYKSKVLETLQPPKLLPQDSQRDRE